MTTKVYIRAEGDIHEEITAEWTNKAEIRLGEQSEKAESCWESLWNEIQLKGPKETFLKRYIVQRTNKAEIRPEKQVRKRRVVGRIYGMKYS